MAISVQLIVICPNTQQFKEFDMPTLVSKENLLFFGDSWELFNFGTFILFIYLFKNYLFFCFWLKSSELSEIKCTKPGKKHVLS